MGGRTNSGGRRSAQQSSGVALSKGKTPLPSASAEWVSNFSSTEKRRWDILMWGGATRAGTPLCWAALLLSTMGAVYNFSHNCNQV